MFEKSAADRAREARVKDASERLADSTIDRFAIVLAGMVMRERLAPADAVDAARTVLVAQIMAYVELFPAHVQKRVAVTLLSDINTLVLQAVDDEGGAHEEPLH